MFDYGISFYSEVEVLTGETAAVGRNINSNSPLCTYLYQVGQTCLDSFHLSSVLTRVIDSGCQLDH